jgi:hypothetical protein
MVEHTSIVDTVAVPATGLPSPERNPGFAQAGDEALDRFLKRFERAKKLRALVDSVIDECYEFALPLRERPYSSREDGRAEMERLFDSTAPRTLQDLASQMLDDVWPADAKPFELVAGPEVPEAAREDVNRALAPVADDIIEAVNNSNFRNEAHEALMDWAIGTGFLLPEEGDAVEPLRFRCLPLAEAYPDLGPFDQVDTLFRVRRVRAADLATVWPRGVFSDDMTRLAQDRGDDTIEVVEGVERDWSEKGDEVWRFRVVAPTHKHTIEEGEVRGSGSKPFVDFSFMRVAGEALGRGPVQIALPDIKTLNLVKQFILENADLAIAGIWQADDDGVINVDTLRIEPRTIIPRAPGSKGLERIDAAGNFNVGDLVVKDLQAAIQATMFGDDLGPPTGTPMSATEVLERTAMRARRRAGPYSRLITEFLFPVVRRVAYIRVRQGAIRLPAIDGKRIAIRPLSPLTRAQAQDEILRHDRFLEMMALRFGPPAAALLVDPEKYGEWLARKMGVDAGLIRKRIERQQMAQAAAAAIAAAQGATP